MTIIHTTILELNTVLQNLSTSIPKKYVKLHYALGRNMTFLSPVLEEIEKRRASIPEYAKYEAERRKLLNKFARKDEKGRPLKKEIPLGPPGGPVREEYDIEDQEALDKAIEKLEAKEEHAKAIADEKDRLKELNELLYSPAELKEVYKIKMSKCRPPDAFNGIQMQILLECGILEWDIEDDDDSLAEVQDKSEAA